MVARSIAPTLRGRRLLQAPADLVETGLGAGFIEIAAGRAADANRPDRFGANFDSDRARQQKYVWQLSQAAGRWRRPDTLHDGATGILVARRAQHEHGIGLIAGSAERRHRGVIA